jgi:hypothetical protein
MKKLFKLINDSDNQAALDIRFGDSNSSTKTWNYVDIALDGNGALQLIDSDESRVQSVLKCLFTERTGSYGSNIYGLIGTKDVVIRRMGLFLDLTMAILSLKLSIDEQKEVQELEDEDLIGSMTKLICTEDPSNPTISKIQMSLQPVSGNAVNVGVL